MAPAAAPATPPGARRVTAAQRSTGGGRGGPAGRPRGATLQRVTSSARATGLPALLAVALLVAGCGGGSEEASAYSSSSPAAPSSSASAEPDDAPAESSDDAGEDDGGNDAGGEDDGGDAGAPFPADVEPDTAEASAGSLVGVTDIRLGRHDGFDRVVFEVGGEGTPGWDVRYVDAPSSQGSGADVAVDGEAVLQVTVTGTGYPMDTGVEEWSGPDPLRAGGTEAVTEVVFDGTFEGSTVAFVGTAARTPFRVYLLEEPARVVLEVADRG